jgi:hypothetical protein
VKSRWRERALDRDGRSPAHIVEPCPIHASTTSVTDSLLRRSLGIDMGQPGTAKRGRARMARLGLCSTILAMLAQGCGASAH